MQCDSENEIAFLGAPLRASDSRSLYACVELGAGRSRLLGAHLVLVLRQKLAAQPRPRGAGYVGCVPDIQSHDVRFPFVCDAPREFEAARAARAAVHRDQQCLVHVLSFASMAIGCDGIASGHIVARIRRPV
jgi:hypothetical protein